MAPSIFRACMMGIIMLGAKIFYRKLDIPTSMSLSLLILLVNNPFSILDIGLQLSYGGTIGILLFAKPLSEKIKTKIPILTGLKEIICVCIGAQIILIPIIMIHFNTISIYFLIANILITPILGISIVSGILILILSYIQLKMAIILSILPNLMLNILLFIPSIISKLPFSIILVKTPFIINIIAYYTVILIGVYFYPIKRRHRRKWQIEIRKQINKKNVIILFIILFSINLGLTIGDKKLTISFIDVGQRRLYFYSNTSKKEDINRWGREYG